MREAWRDICITIKLIVSIGLGPGPDDKPSDEPVLKVHHSQGQFTEVFGHDLPGKDKAFDFHRLYGKATNKETQDALLNSLVHGRSYSQYINLYCHDNRPLSCHITMTPLRSEHGGSMCGAVDMERRVYGSMTIRSASIVGNSKCFGMGLIDMTQVPEDTRKNALGVLSEPHMMKVSNKSTPNASHPWVPSPGSDTTSCETINEASSVTSASATSISTTDTTKSFVQKPASHRRAAVRKAKPTKYSVELKNRKLPRKVVRDKGLLATLSILERYVSSSPCSDASTTTESSKADSGANSARSLRAVTGPAPGPAVIASVSSDVVSSATNSMESVFSVQDYDVSGPDRHVQRSADLNAPLPTFMKASLNTVWSTGKVKPQF